MTNIISTFAFARIGRRAFLFTTANEVSAAYRATIDRLGLGGSRTPPCDLLDADGRKVGYVSYNGKVWSGDWDAGTAVCLFNPCLSGCYPHPLNVGWVHSPE
jgi:hypothetical protein